MKKIIFFIAPIFLFCLLAISFLFSQSVPDFPSGAGTNQIIKKQKNLQENPITSLKCKTCHISEFPTLKDPGLINCPRNSMYGDFPSSKEGPEVVVIDEMSEYYTGVVFSHRLHSEMSEMSMGCTDCHHYNTSGPVLNCRECHSKERYREDVFVPDLKAAFHRQCISCHKEWSHENSCNSVCHLRNTPENQKLVKKDYTGKQHPKRTEPTKLVYETSYEKGKKVTFYHDEHIKLFKIGCIKCHNNDKCIKCHDKQKAQVDLNKPVQTKKSFEEHHQPCMNCHKSNECDKCHQEKEMAPFNHGKSTGWVLKLYHSQLTCAKCHGNQTPLKKLDRNCNTCHENFLPGKFEHGKTGLILSENHKDMECISCHINNDFAKNPECKMCHDDKSHPAHSPGKRK